MLNAHWITKGIITFPPETTKVTVKELEGMDDDIRVIIIPALVSEIDFTGFTVKFSLDELVWIEVSQENKHFTAVDAFYSCEELEGVSIPAGVTKIGEGAFGDCPKLTIHCVEGSVAHGFAIDNKIPFQFYEEGFKLDILLP
jgi:hypothetical protein